jgi:hypothetical protein
MIVERSQPEWLDLKSLQRYACVSARTLRGWIQRPVEPLPVIRVQGKTLIRRSTFDQWLETDQPLIAELSSHLRKKSSRPGFLSTSRWFGKDVCDEAVAWLANFVSPAAAWDSCERGDWMLWLLEHVKPLTEDQWEELERALEPLWAKRHQAQAPDETTQAIAEYELGKARALRKIFGNPWRSQNGNV